MIEALRGCQTPGMKHIHLNHVALLVASVSRSSAFYENVLGLEPIGRPNFDFPGAWYRLGDDQELHLICQGGDTQTRSGANHFALMVDDMDAAVATLEQRGGQIARRQVRPDGAEQIYLRDPDGHTIEVCTAPPADG